MEIQILKKRERKNNPCRHPSIPTITTMSNGTIFFWFNELNKGELETKLGEFNIPKGAKVEFKIHNKNTIHSLCLGSWHVASASSNQ